MPQTILHGVIIMNTPEWYLFNQDFAAWMACGAALLM
jgi:hypothetical protein